jgi:hypothetical protein
MLRQNERGDRRVFVPQHCERVPCGPPAQHNHRGVHLQSLPQHGLGRGEDELSRRLGKAVWLASGRLGKFGSEELFGKNPLGRLLEVYARVNRLFKPEQEASQKARDEGRNTTEIESTGLFAQRNAYFKRMEDGEPEAIRL